MAKAIQKRSSNYDSGRKGYSKELVKLILGWNSSMGRKVVLDLGTGTGVFVASLVKHFRKRLGTDISQDRIDFAKKTHKDVQFSLGSGDKIDLPDSSVDLISAAQCFMYFDRAKALSEVRRVLRPNGTLSVLWKYPESSSSVILAINAAVEEINKKMGSAPLRPIPNGSENVRNESLIRDLAESGFARIAYEELPAVLKFSRDDVRALAIHSTGFAVANLDSTLEKDFLAALDRHLGKGKSWRLRYLEHVFLGAAPG